MILETSLDKVFFRRLAPMPHILGYLVSLARADKNYKLLFLQRVNTQLKR